MAYTYPTVFPLVAEGNIFSGGRTTVSGVWELIPESFMSEDAVAPAPFVAHALVRLDKSDPLLSPANSDWSYCSGPVGSKPMDWTVSLADCGRGGEDDDDDDAEGSGQALVAAGSGQAAVKPEKKRKRDLMKELSVAKRTKLGEKENVKP